MSYDHICWTCWHTWTLPCQRYKEHILTLTVTAPQSSHGQSSGDNSSHLCFPEESRFECFSLVSSSRCCAQSPADDPYISRRCSNETDTQKDRLYIFRGQFCLRVAEGRQTTNGTEVELGIHDRTHVPRPFAR